VRMLAYNGSIPGPTVRVGQGSEIVVQVTNGGDNDPSTEQVEHDREIRPAHHGRDVGDVGATPPLIRPGRGEVALEQAGAGTAAASVPVVLVVVPGGTSPSRIRLVSTRGRGRCRN
jgi:FtsP/CotA-like multicopper oxidase with cupredoxin domain